MAGRTLASIGCVPESVREPVARQYAGLLAVGFRPIEIRFTVTAGTYGVEAARRAA